MLGGLSALVGEAAVPWVVLRLMLSEVGNTERSACVCVCACGCGRACVEHKSKVLFHVFDAFRGFGPV